MSVDEMEARNLIAKWDTTHVRHITDPPARKHYTPVRYAIARAHSTILCIAAWLFSFGSYFFYLPVTSRLLVGGKEEASIYFFSLMEITLISRDNDVVLKSIEQLH